MDALGENFGQTGLCTKMEELADAVCYFCDLLDENKWETKGTYCVQLECYAKETLYRLTYICFVWKASQY